MKHEKLSWQTRDGLKVHSKVWRAPSEPKAVVCIVHGMGEHAGRYGHVAAHLAANNISTVAFDHRGHGETEGKRGHMPQFESLMEDVDSALEAVKKAVPGAPIILYGHSMGGNVVTNYLLRRKPQDIIGAVVTAPWFKLAFEPPGFLVFLGKIMNVIWPGFTNKSTLNSADLSRDPEIPKKYDADPLVHAYISARFFNDITEAGVYSLDHAADLSTPTLLMHGSGDKVTSFPSSQAFAAKAPKDQLTFVEWKDFYHEIHNDIGQEDVLERISTFVQSRLE